ncbi:hypothetical protein Sru01_60730 [Sphaerisporangium rufum]|uniref:N-acetyltransferase domain-containing protein n=1 Tax=Sphaerisporangium rufum TaxID=1381558 RepID=A0A919R9V7_9ACTN|nr:hypothetical protein Sru01_60730 [Sphaerisporangium rufum]
MTAAGYHARRPVPGDAAAVHRLVSARDLEVLGHPDATLDDLTDQLTDASLDLGRDAWLVHPPGAPDTVAGYAQAWRQRAEAGVPAEVDIEVYAADERLVRPLWDAVLARAGRMAGAAGSPRAVVSVQVYRQDAATAEVAASYGFQVATGFHRLRADHPVGPVADPDPPSGVTVRAAHGSAELTRAAYRIHQEGFAEHFGFVPKSYDAWLSAYGASATSDWSQLLVAEADGRPAGMLLGSDMFAADENCGYVRLLAVLPGYRGRGIGRTLLRHAFAADARRGRSGTYLHVDAGNTTPALTLYLSAGMRPVLVIDVWRGAVQPAPDSPAGA